MGALIMAHSDDNGLVLPPKLAPIQAVIVPIYRKEEEFKQVSEVAKGIVSKLRDMNIDVKFDDNDKKKPGWKFAEYELKGVPVRLAIGPRDVQNGTVEVARRDTLEKKVVPMEGVEKYIQGLLNEIQENIYNKALNFRAENTTKVDSYDEFKKVLKEKGGFILAHWDGTDETEQRIKDETKATIRCIPLESEPEEGKCMVTGKPSKQRVVFAVAY
jgi:prolyl-tRNA synthetase